MIYFRLFIALELSKMMLSKISKARLELQAIFPQPFLRWVPIEKFHITLKFLEKIPEIQIPELNNALKSTALKSAKCSAEIASLGAFPSLRKPNSIWIGVHPDDAMKDLFNKLESNLKIISIPLDTRGFSPHITLARVSSNASQFERETISKRLFQVDLPSFGQDTFKQLHLYKSEIHHGGYVYSILNSEMLQ